VYSRLLRAIGPRTAFGTVCAFADTPAGARVAEFDIETVVDGWDAATGERRTAPRAFPYQAGSLVWSPDRTHIASAGADATVRIWSVNSGSVVQTPDGPAQSLAWSPDGRYLAGGGTPRDWLVWLWDAHTGRRVALFDDNSYGPAALAWSPDGRYLAGAGAAYGRPPARDRETVHVWEVATGAVVYAYGGHREGTAAISWSPDGHWIATGGGPADRTVHVWEPLSGRARTVYRAHAGRVLAVDWSPDSQRVASAAGDEDATVHVWRVDGRDPDTVYSGHSAPATHVHWSPAGDRIASAPHDGSVHVWDAATGSRRAGPPEPAVRALSWSPDGAELNTCAWRGVVRVWEARSRAHVSSLHSHGGRIDELVWSPDGTLLATGGDTPGIDVWDVSTSELIATRAADRDQELLAWSPDGTRVAGRDTGYQLFILDVGTGRAVVGQHDNRYATVMAWSPDGSRIATAGQDHLAQVWDAGSLRPIATYRGHPDADWVRLGSWSPDGTRLLSMGEIDHGMHSARYFRDNPHIRDDPRIHLWNADTGDPVLAYEGHRLPPRKAHWSPDGTLIASTDTSQVQVWTAGAGRRVLTAARDNRTGTWAVSRLADAPVVIEEIDESNAIDVSARDNPLWSPEGQLLLTGADWRAHPR
jgi:WD40 repeat protein